MRHRILQENIHVRQAVLSFSGLPDAGKVSERTISELKNQFPWHPAATLDLEGFWDAESCRPQVHVQHGQIQSLAWPAYELTLLDLPSGPPVLLGTGPEPTTSWQSFTRQFLKLLVRWGCKEIILLGSLYDQIYHDDIMISGVSQDTRGYDHLKTLGCRSVEYAGPGAIHSALMQAAQSLDIYCLAIWAHFPFYLDAPHELLTAHLLQVLGQLLHAEFDTIGLRETWRRREKEIVDLIEQNEDLQQVLDSMRLEERRDQPPPAPSNVIKLDAFAKKRKGPGPNGK